MIPDSLQVLLPCCWIPPWFLFYDTLRQCVLPTFVAQGALCVLLLVCQPIHVDTPPNPTPPEGKM